MMSPDWIGAQAAASLPVLSGSTGDYGAQSGRTIGPDPRIGQASLATAMQCPRRIHTRRHDPEPLRTSATEAEGASRKITRWSSIRLPRQINSVACKNAPEPMAFSTNSATPRQHETARFGQGILVNGSGNHGALNRTRISPSSSKASFNPVTGPVVFEIG